MQIFIHHKGEQIGPYTQEQVSDMLHSGELESTELCWHEGLEDWQPLGTIAQFHPDIASKGVSTKAAKAEQGALMEIARDGKVIGSWTLEEIQSFLLSGNLVGSDYYLEGDKWLPLSNLIPRQTPPPPPAPAAPSQSVVLQQQRAINAQDEDQRPSQFLNLKIYQQQNIVTGEDEEELWVGRPSQLLNAKFFFWWLFLLLIASLATPVVRESAPDYVPLSRASFVIFFLIFVLSALRRILKIWATRYVISNQRVKVIQGILSKDVSELELFRVKDTMVHQSLFLRLFGLGHVAIVSGDAMNPVLLLRGIPRAVDIRERLRAEVLVLRQKLNVRQTELM